jgi:hypothetical protein
MRGDWRVPTARGARRDSEQMEKVCCAATPKSGKNIAIKLYPMNAIFTSDIHCALIETSINARFENLRSPLDNIDFGDTFRE